MKVGNSKVGDLMLSADSRALEASKSMRTGRAQALALLGGWGTCTWSVGVWSAF